MFTFIAMTVISLLLIAMACDLRTREIPDWVSVAIAAIGLMSSMAGWHGVGPVWMLAGGFAGIFVGWLLFRFAHFGGGDAKLIGAIGCVVGPVGLLMVLFVMAIAGGVLSLVAMFRGQRDYAYVPAITAGFVWYVSVVSLI
ncbi:Type IV leader peptidase family protein [Stieleria neptunia]|uniref:Type IV leader peptidase family protein n=1 Tax=Stieleria neptunia TaxID=2527979 RepID=A0A518HYB2_9BACT|nr:A24 family peptidase [Stieleria neptunia]QDV45839.1 Type IV leader peptidase family protein [Stieleria neptunia]